MEHSAAQPVSTALQSVSPLPPLLPPAGSTLPTTPDHRDPVAVPPLAPTKPAPAPPASARTPRASPPRPDALHPMPDAPSRASCPPALADRCPAVPLVPYNTP